MKKIILTLFLLFSFIGIANAKETVCFYPLSFHQGTNTQTVATITFDSDGNLKDSDFLTFDSNYKEKVDKTISLEKKNINQSDLKDYGYSSCPKNIFYNYHFQGYTTNIKYYLAIRENDNVINFEGSNVSKPESASLNISKSILPNGSNKEVDEIEHETLEGRVECLFPLKGTAKVMITYQDGKISTDLRNAPYSEIGSENLEIKFFTKTGELQCPDNLYYLTGWSSNKTIYDISFEDNMYNKYEENGVESNNSEIDIANSKYKWYDNYKDFKPPSCNIFGDITNEIWLLLRILAPGMAIIFGAMDFLKAVAANDDKDIQKSVKRFIKRLIILVVIFLLPTIVNLIIGFTQFKDLTACF